MTTIYFYFNEIDRLLKKHVFTSSHITYDIYVSKDETYLHWIEYELAFHGNTQSIIVRLTRIEGDIEIDFGMLDRNNPDKPRLNGRLMNSLTTEILDKFDAVKPFLLKGGWSKFNQ